MCGESYYRRRGCTKVDDEPQAKKGAAGSGFTDDRALLAVLLERERVFEALLQAHRQRKRA